MGGGFALSLAPPLHPSHIEYSISIDADLKTSGNASVYFLGPCNSYIRTQRNPVGLSGICLLTLSVQQDQAPEK